MTDHANSDDAPASVADLLASEIRRRRNAAGLSQRELARRSGYTREYVSMAERTGSNLPSRELVSALDSALCANGTLVEMRTRARTEQAARRNPAWLMTASGPDWIAPTSNASGKMFIDVPAGRFFSGASIAVQRFAAVDDGRIVATVPAGFASDPFLMRPGRGLVIGVSQAAGRSRYYGVDSRRSRVRLARATEGAPLLIPHAYELDDLTLGILWAIANFDEALLDDDAELAARTHHVNALAEESQSTGSWDLGAELASVSQMWLGSDFCARHILRNSDVLTDVPTFWTREQRGEEASAWLLFAHKYEYLYQSAAKFEYGASKSSRSFCIPRSTVEGSTPSERMLLLLAVALMESFGISVEICAEPEYSAMQGFVSDHSKSAIVASWVGTEGIWQVDITDSRPTLREFADASGFASAHSIIAASTPGLRLQALADYLDLDWKWLVVRCGDLGEYGCAGLAQPRSRLLSVVGLDQACRFVGEVGR